MAQDRYQDDNRQQPAPIQQPSPETRQSEITRSVTDRAGQRQSRELLSQDAGIEPMARINGRILNRVQSRIRNRITAITTRRPMPPRRSRLPATRRAPPGGRGGDGVDGALHPSEHFLLESTNGYGHRPCLRPGRFDIPTHLRAFE